jgi:hypothetical protein
MHVIDSNTVIKAGKITKDAQIILFLIARELISDVNK